MTISEFYDSLTKKINIPIFYEVIYVEQNDEMPPVYIYFTTGETQSIFADNIVYWSSTPVQLIINHGSVEINEEIKNDVDEYLNENRMPYSVEDGYDNDLTAWLSTYNFNI